MQSMQSVSCAQHTCRITSLVTSRVFMCTLSMSCCRRQLLRLSVFRDLPTRPGASEQFGDCNPPKSYTSNLDLLQNVRSLVRQSAKAAVLVVVTVAAAEVAAAVAVVAQHRMLMSRRTPLFPALAVDAVARAEVLAEAAVAVVAEAVASMIAAMAQGAGAPALSFS
jgi:hypothetical protein